MRRMFYNYYFSLSFLCLAHFLLLCSASSSPPPPLSLPLSRFRIYLFGVFFCAKVYTSFDFRSGFERAKNLSVFVFFFFFIYLCFLLVLPSLALPFPLLSRLFCLLCWHTRLSMISLSRQFAASLKRLHLSVRLDRRDRLIRDLSIFRVSPFASQLFVRCFTCLVSASLCSCLFRFFISLSIKCLSATTLPPPLPFLPNSFDFN